MTAEALIIKVTPKGRKTYPIKLAEALKMVEAGEATQYSACLFEQKKPVNGIYQTKVMTPESPQKKRGRPKKQLKIMDY